MARYKNGINGRFKGKVGSVVGVERRGTAYMRSLPDGPKRAATVKQAKGREVFSLVVKWLKPLQAIIKIGFQAFAGSRTEMNCAVSYHLKNALTEEQEGKVIDFAKAVFSIGELFISLMKEITALTDAIVQIKWENAAISVFNSAEDAATFIFYNPSKNKFVSFENAAQRQLGEVSLQLPAEFVGNEVHCWMQYVNATGTKVSTTAYLGAVVV